MLEKNSESQWYITCIQPQCWQQSRTNLQVVHVRNETKTDSTHKHPRTDTGQTEESENTTTLTAGILAGTKYFMHSLPSLEQIWHQFTFPHYSSTHTHLHTSTYQLPCKHSLFPQQLILLSTYSAMTITDVHITNLQGRPQGLLVLRFTLESQQTWLHDFQNVLHSMSQLQIMFSNS